MRPATGLASSLTETIGLERPVFLGGSGAGVAVPAPTPTPGAPGGLRAARRGVIARALGHPYVRLAQNGSFGALWVGQLVSLFGDRLHQLALVALVGEATQNGAFAVAMVFVAATVPNLVFGPLAGALVDRWDQKRVMIASDLLRAAIVLLIPVAATADVLLVYPLVFALTTVSIFFRPARTAVIPRIVKDDELVAANSAIWLGDSLADVAGLPAGGPLRRLPRQLAGGCVLGGRGDLPRLGGADRHDGHPGRRPDGGRGGAGPARPARRPASPAGGSCAASPCSWPTPCRRSSASSRSA